VTIDCQTDSDRHDAPSRASLEASARATSDAFDCSQSADDEIACFERWERDRRAFATWRAGVELRFRLDTADPQRIEDARRLAELRPIADEGDIATKRRLLESKFRRELVDALGEHIFTVWTQAIAGDGDATSVDLAQETELVNRYSTVFASARIEFDGSERSLVSLSAFAESHDRTQRERAMRASWALLEANASEVDGIFGQLVETRARIANSQGASSFADVAFRRLGRSDFGEDDIIDFRAEIEREIVPLVEEMRAGQARAIGVDELMPWDEQVFDSSPSPTPPLSALDLADVMHRAFADLGPAFGDFARFMIARGRLDLSAGPNKTGGAFCTFFPTTGLPFVFVHTTGTSRDVGSLVHEMGHAFQDYSARDKRVSELIIPTAESGEIHAMSMEYLLFPHYDRFFGNDAKRFCSRHLRTMVGMLPYVAAIDEFQSLVYREPHVDANARAKLWSQVERRYMPWRHRGAYASIDSSGAWHRQRHVFAFRSTTSITRSRCAARCRSGPNRRAIVTIRSIDSLHSVSVEANCRFAKRSLPRGFDRLSSVAHSPRLQVS